MLHVLVLICSCTLSIQQVTNLSYEILSEGEEIQLNLQDYFQFANESKINEDKSSPNYKEIFDVYKNNEPYRQINIQAMEFQYGNKTIKLSDYSYYSTKAFYNQPLKLFLLDNNFILMYVYNDQHDEYGDKNQVLGLNLTQNLPSYLKNKKITCTSMETQSTYQYDLVYVVCKAEESNKLNSFFLVEVNLIHNSQGFVQNLQTSSYHSLLNRTNICNEYTLKYFQQMRLNSQTILSNIFAYCKQKPSNTGPNDIVFHFYIPQAYVENVTFRALSRCLTNASYISHSENGFLSVINKQVYQYYTNQTSRQSQCIGTDLTNIDSIFATSRVYNNIDITYYFLHNNTIIIKSSYRTNYQTLEIDRKGFKMTGFALTLHFMALSMSNGSNSLLMIYSMDELYPKLIDERVLTNQKGTYQSAMLMSTNNYLERGYYVFFYDKYKNQVSLNEYKGYILSIKPKSEKFYQSIFQSKSEICVKPFFPKNKEITSYNDSRIKDVSKFYTIFLESYVQQKTEELAINIVIRNFNDPNIILLPTKELNIDSTYVNFNLSALAIGPVQKFYSESNKHDKNIHMEFINYYNTINISFILDSTNQCSTTFDHKKGGTQKLKQIALNLQLKVVNPVFTLYYGTCIQNCALNHIKQDLQFKLQCQKQNRIQFKSSIQTNDSKIIVLTKDKWVQYNQFNMEYCTITGQSGQCQLLPMNQMPLLQKISRIKLVKFDSRPNGYTYIQIFVICDNMLHYGYFLSRKGNSAFNYTKIFLITSDQIQQLETMKLTNIHFDKFYTNFLLLHLSLVEGPLIKHTALLFDHPNQSKSGKFLGHLIKIFDNQQMESIMTIDNLIIIIYRLENGDAIINEFKVTQFYSVYQTRTYPLYGRKVVQNGAHVSDGSFLYIEVEIQEGEKQGQTEYLVFCPAMSATNVLTHVIPKQSMITFIQQIGSTQNKYPHSIGINGRNIFALSIPNMVIKFDNDNRKYKSGGEDYSLQLYSGQKESKTFEEGQILLKMIDYRNTMHNLVYKYVFDISAEAIIYNPKDQAKINISSSKPLTSYKLEVEKIVGPVMGYSLNINNCPFLQSTVKFQDVFTNLQCLINIDAKIYGTLLDMKSMSLSIDKSVQIIVTTNYLMCVENRQIKTFIEMPITKACNIVDDQQNKIIIVCDQGQGSVIHVLQLGESCMNLFKQNIAKPKWLIYQYFRVKYQQPYIVFEVPIRVEFNKIYFLTKFDSEKKQFSDKFYSLTHKQLDHFLSKDFDINSGYAFILQQGLGIYSIDDEDGQNETNIEPVAWISKQKLAKALNSSTQFVYFKPEIELQHKIGQRCKGNFTNSIHGQIGTISHAYLVKICFNDDDMSIDNQYEIIPIIIYKQYKDCKNNVLSKSKNWGGLTIKLCVLELQQYRIFANYMPINPKSSEYYMQFYATDQDNPNLQTLYPFRMEKVSTNSTFQIKQYEGELIVRSLFNFMCYYQLETQVKWTFFINPNYTKTSRECNASITLKNQNFINEINLFIKNMDPVPENTYKPWIFRVAFFILVSVSLFKWYLNYKSKSIKLHKLRNNLFSNQFEFKVRINTKKSIEVELLGEEDQDEDEDQDEIKN